MTIHPLALVSTKTVDRFLKPSGEVEQAIPGGPAHYVGYALTRLGCPFRLYTGETATVEVLRTSSGEEYVIPRLPLIPLPERISAPATILSPIMQEIDPQRVPPVDGLLVVDLQGFVREPNRPSGSPGKRFDLSDLLHRSDIVKAASDELDRLTEPSRFALDGVILLTTRGADGAALRIQGREYVIEARRVAAPHTIGAGDTFLAAFVHGMITGLQPEQAAVAASGFTAKILEERVTAPDRE